MEESFKIAIYGAGGQGREVLQLIRQINRKNRQWECIGWFDDGYPKFSRVAGLPILGGIQELNNWTEPLHIAIAIGWPAVKKKILQKINNKKLVFPTLIHPSVDIDPGEVIIGEGTIIAQGCHLTVNIQIGRFVLINLGCVLTHDCIIGDYCGLMPSVNISGEVIVGESAYLGTGVQVIQQCKVGAGSIIGAGAVIIENIPSNCTAVGIPARPVKFNIVE